MLVPSGDQLGLRNSPRAPGAPRCTTPPAPTVDELEAAVGPAAHVADAIRSASSRGVHFSPAPVVSTRCWPVATSTLAICVVARSLNGLRIFCTSSTSAS